MAAPPPHPGPPGSFGRILKVDGHYMQQILMGRKDWELRLTPNSTVVGRWIGLAATGSRHVVGRAYVRAMEMYLPDRMGELLAQQERHCVTPADLMSYANDSHGSPRALYVFWLCHVQILTEPPEWSWPRGSIAWAVSTMELRAVLAVAPAVPAGTLTETATRTMLDGVGARFNRQPWLGRAPLRRPTRRTVGAPARTRMRARIRAM
jgi:hypothetical protein